MYDIEFAKQAIKDLRRIPKDYASHIVNRIKLVAIDPYGVELDIKKLKATDKAYRLRIGNYRVIYEIEEQKLLVTIIKIQSRGNVYG
ncbi:type II toxin-antitoxin system RelE family toxin [Candidatus Tisiphia endosymbiont of Hybos culiciformis]|uniref:type II toxin-antitoxin system RelE family toxin n=1 Tax=Candidatus Tisiphia endosymbiont of Hybos culiciformis TaxID=3139331 RepID=UPI003CCABA95